MKPSALFQPWAAAAAADSTDHVEAVAAAAAAWRLRTVWGSGCPCRQLGLPRPPSRYDALLPLLGKVAIDEPRRDNSSITRTFPFLGMDGKN